MDPGESPSQKSPGSRGFFDPAHLLGGHSMFPGRPPTSRDQPPYITHMPSAFSMFNQPLYPPRSPHSDFGGLGSLREGLTSPLGSPNALTHGPLSPTAGLHWPLTASVQLCNLATLGGAAWWRHARSMAGLSEYYSGTLGLTAPTFGSGGREREASPPGFDSLYRQSQAQKSLNGAFCGPLFPPASSVLSLSSPTKSSSPATSTTTSLAMTSTVVSTSSSSSSSSSSKHKGQRGRPKGNSYKNSSNTLRIPGSTSSVSDKSKDSKISQPTLSIPQPSTPVFAHSSVITKASSTTTTSLSSAASSTGVTTAVSPSTKTDSNKKKNGKETSSSDSSSSSSDDSSDDLGSSSDSSSSNSDISSGSDNSDGGNSESDSDDKEMEDILQTKKELEEKQKQLLKQEQQLKKQQQDSLERRLKDQQDVKDQRDQEQRLKQEQLKMQLEQHIKQQQHQLKLQKKAQAEREKAFAAKAQAVAAATQHGLSSINTGALTQVTNSASGTQRSNPTSVITPTKTHKSKSQVAQDGTESGVSSPASKSSTSSTPIVARFRGVDYKDLSTKNSTKDDLSDSDSISSGDSDDSQSVSSDSDSDDGSLSSDESCDDEHTDTDPDLKLTDTSMNNTPVKTSTPIDQGKGRKRSSTGATAPGSVNSSLTAGNTSSRTKRRRMEDEDEARAPLENGWRRETTIRQLGPGDRLRGEVVYYAPCGKKVKTYPEVIRYLEKHRITAISRDNFSFSVKIKIGDFLNPKPDGNNGITYEKMTESQVKRALVQDDPKKLRALERQFKREDKRRATQELARKAAESKMQRKLEQQEMTKRALETKRRRKLDSLRNIQEAKEARRNRALLAAEERRRQKDHLKFLKHQEKLQRLEQMRLEKEMRAQQILEQRRKKKEAQALKKSTELEERMKEREIRRQQAVLMKNQERERRKHLLVMERERRKQHMMLVRALEARKKAEEKERLKQEKKAEKKMTRERKMEQKRFELQMAKELKKPVEDLQLRDLKTLPDIPRLNGVKLPSNAFADCLMVLEFLHNFGESLGLDLEDDVPTLETLQDGLLNDEESYSEVVTLTIQLLNSALQDPGLPTNNGKGKTCLDQSITDVDIDENNLSEVLRLYIKHSSGTDHELSSALYEVPFKALSATLKAQCLGYLVNDLVCSQNIVEDIDKNIEHMSSLRRDKWIIEGKLRKMRTLQAKKFNRPMPVKANNLDDSTSLLDTTLETMDGDNSNLSGIGKKRKREDEDEDEEDDDDSDGTEETGADGEDVEDETEPTNADEMDKKIDKLTKQQCQFRNKLFEASHALRAMSFGQDRFRRRFWVLPHAGGIYVEGMASAELPDDMKHELEHQEKLDKKEEIKSQIEPCRETALDLSMPTASSTPGATPKIKTEPEPEQNLFLQKPENFSRLSELLQVAKQEPESDCNALAPSEAVSDAAATVTSHCPTQTQAGLNTFRLNSGLPPVTQAESNAGFVKLDNYVHQKNDSHFAMAASSFSSGQISAEQLLKGLADQPNGTKPWFSILPQMPCNETPRTHSSPNKAMQDSSVPAFGVSAFHIPSGTFSTIPIPGLKTSSASPSLAFPGLAHGFIPVSAMSAFGFPSSLISSATSSPQSLCEASKEFMTAQAQNEAMANMKALLGERENKVTAPIPEDMKFGWWHIVEPETIKNITRCLHPRGIRERILQKNLLKYADFASSACTAKGSEYFQLDDEDDDDDDESDNDEDEESKNTKHDPLMPDTKDWSCEVAFEVTKSALEDVEALEDKVFSSSMQIKNWKPRVKASSDDTLESLESAQKSGVDVLEITKDRLLTLEKSVERRYLKAPLSKSTVQINIDKMGVGAADDDSRPSSPTEDVTKGLANWRGAVKVATNSAQLRMCLDLLERSIAWEKSIMKVYCQFCLKGDNEELLLLCDGCDKGFHTYCFKPKMNSIPEGDWYCYECIYKATGEYICVLCRHKGRLVKCENCPRAYHPDCIDPPLLKMPRGRWFCQACQKQKNKTSRGKGKKQKVKEKEVKPVSPPPTSDSSNSDSRSQDWSDKFKEDKVNRKQSSKDMAPCRTILTEMEKHDDGWPFLMPVDTKQFSTYKKVIKHPMDFHTMKCKLRDGQYRCRDDFEADAHLVFHNCEVFNEDDSDVGRAGHSMQRFFRKRWVELNTEDQS